MQRGKIIMKAKKDYMDILLQQVNDQLKAHLDAIVEMRLDNEGNNIYVRTYIKQVINQIYYFYNLADDVYTEARNLNILKKRHHRLFDMTFYLKVEIDAEIYKSGYALNMFGAHTKANKSS